VRQKLHATVAAHEVKLGFEESLIWFVRHTEEKEREGRRRWPWLYKDMKSKNRTRSSDNIRVPTPRSILSSSTLDGLPRQPIPSRPASERGSKKASEPQRMRSAEPIYAYEAPYEARPARMRSGAPPPPVRGSMAFGNGYETTSLTPRTAAALPRDAVLPVRRSGRRELPAGNGAWDSGVPPGTSYLPNGANSYPMMQMPSSMGFAPAGYPQVGFPMTSRGVSPVPSPLISARAPPGAAGQLAMGPTMSPFP
jgi:hypothetical protein